ncbi:MAG: hypothetical protein M3077_12470 [Candidatus Dormibacteraeota bacterium]|nr:hypothetical protein [Candidatus Dormibacteraeota bacterium]
MAVTSIFIRYYVELEHPMPALERALLQAPTSWLPALAESADVRGQRLLTEVGFRFEGRRIVKKVAVTVGNPVRTSSRTFVPIAWRATGVAGFFPVLDGDLEVAPLSPARTQLAFSGQYRPPLGLIGRTVDRTLCPASRKARSRISSIESRSAWIANHRAKPWLSRQPGPPAP